MRINYQGTVNLINACKKHGVPKMVMSSSPSTRFTGEDIDGLSDWDLPEVPMKKCVHCNASSMPCVSLLFRVLECFSEREVSRCGDGMRKNKARALRGGFVLFCSFGLACSARSSVVRTPQPFLLALFINNNCNRVCRLRYLQAYAGSKAAGERACRDACCDSFLTVAVAPHQVYGPRDNLFMPNVLEAAASGKLRVFAKSTTGNGMNKVCYTHVDNYAHGLIMAEKALYSGSPALGKFYIVTDGDTHSQKEGYGYFWVELDKIVVQLGFTSLFSKFKLPYWFLMIIAYICNFIGWVLGIKLKLNPFNIKVLTMHRWFTIDNAIRDLGFYPIISFKDGWHETGEWFKENWLPKLKESKRLKGGKGGMFGGIATQSKRKIDIQAGKEDDAQLDGHFVDE